MCFSSLFNTPPAFFSFLSSLRHRQSKDVSVIKAAGANGGISSHADSLHHWTDRWIPHTDTQTWGAPTCKHTYTHADKYHQWRPVKMTDVGSVLPAVGGRVSDMSVEFTSCVDIHFKTYIGLQIIT